MKKKYEKVTGVLKIAGLRRSAPVCAGLRRFAPVHFQNFWKTKITISYYKIKFPRTTYSLQ